MHIGRTHSIGMRVFVRVYTDSSYQCCATARGMLSTAERNATRSRAGCYEAAGPVTFYEHAAGDDRHRRRWSATDDDAPSSSTINDEKKSAAAAAASSAAAAAVAAAVTATTGHHILRGDDTHT